MRSRRGLLAGWPGGYRGALRQRTAATVAGRRTIPRERAAGAINSSVSATARRERANGPGTSRAGSAHHSALRAAVRVFSPSSRRRRLVAAGRAIRAGCCAAPDGAAPGAPRSGAPLRRAHVAHAGGLPATRRAATARGVALRPSSRAARDGVVRPALAGGRDAGLATSTDLSPSV